MGSFSLGVSIFFVNANTKYITATAKYSIIAGMYLHKRFNSSAPITFGVVKETIISIIGMIFNAATTIYHFLCFFGSQKMLQIAKTVGTSTSKSPQFPESKKINGGSMSLRVNQTVACTSKYAIAISTVLIMHKFLFTVVFIAKLPLILKMYVTALFGCIVTANLYVISLSRLQFIRNLRVAP